MKILLLGNTSPNRIGIGGVETTLKYIVKHINTKTNRLTVVGVTDRSQTPQKSMRGGVHFLELPYRSTKLFKAKNVLRSIEASLEAIIEDEEPDVIWSRSLEFSVAALQAGYKRPILHIYPTLAHMMVTIPPYSGSLPSWIEDQIRRFIVAPIRRAEYSWMERTVIEHCQTVVFCSNMRDQIRKRYAVADEDIHVFHPGVDHTIFNPQNGKRMEKTITARFGLTREERYSLYVGRLTKIKNIPSLLKSLVLTKGKQRLVLVGEGPERRYLEGLSRSVGLGTRVLFVGPQTDLLPGFYSMARVFINPALVEPFGHVLIESLACGTPIVGIRSDGSKTMTAVEEVSCGGRFGRCADPDRFGSLAGCIDHFSGMGLSEYRKMSAQACQYVRRDYQWRSFISKLMGLSKKGVPS